MYNNIENYLGFSGRSSMGEVQTPNELAQEMIDKLPEEIFISDKTTFLDPCFGSGTFLRAITKKLREYGHSNENISSRLIGIEKSIRFINTVGRVGNIKPTLIHANFLEYDFKDMKFDVVIGNPPYNNGTKGNSKLWPSFVESSFNVLKPNGFLVYITPDNWLKGDSKKIRRATQFLYNQQVTYLNLDTSNYFPTIGESICSYIVENKKKQYSTSILYKGTTHTELIEGPLDLLVDKKVKNLNDKIINKYPKEQRIGPNRHYDISFKKSLEEHLNEGTLSNEQNDLYDTLIYSTTNRKAYIPFNSITQDKWRVMVNMSGYYFKPEQSEKYMPILRNIGTWGRVFSILCDTEEQAINTKSFLSSKLYRWYVDTNKQGGFNVVAVHLPLLDNTRLWTDQEIYKHFNLTQEEIDLIENTIK